jgi:hypothetical protein
LTPPILERSIVLNDLKKKREEKRRGEERREEKRKEEESSQFVEVHKVDLGGEGVASCQEPAVILLVHAMDPLDITA